MTSSIWIAALVIAALAPTLVRLTADWLERRARQRSRALLASAGVNLRDASRGPSSNLPQDVPTDTGASAQATSGENETIDEGTKSRTEQSARSPR